MSSLRLTMTSFCVIIAVLVTQRISSAEKSTFLIPEEHSITNGDVWFPPSSQSHHLTKRQSPFDLPIVNALMWTLGILAFLLPFRMYRVNPAASKRKDATSAPIDVTESPMTESAILAHRIVKAVEDGGFRCANYTICTMADEVKKMGSRQEVTISIAEKFLPESLLPTVDVLRKAIMFPKVDEFCQQFECAESHVNSNSVSGNSNQNNNNNNNPKDEYYSPEEVNENNANINEVETVTTLNEKSNGEKITPFPMVEPADSEEEISLDMNATELLDQSIVPEWRKLE